MADAEATLRVNVEGEEQVQALADAFDALGGKAGEATTTAASAAKDAQESALGNFNDFWKGLSVGMIDELGKVRAEFEAQQRKPLPEVPDKMEPSAAKFGAVAGLVSAGIDTMISAAQAFVKAVDPISNSLNAARDSAANTLTAYKEAQRAGIGYEQAQAKLTAAQFAGIENYGQMAERLSKAITPEKVGGKKTADVFKQLGITPQYMAELAKAGERIDPFGFIDKIGSRWDKLHETLAGAKTPQAIAAAQQQISKFQDALAKVLPRNMQQQIADILRTTTPEERQRWAQTGERIQSQMGPTQAPEVLTGQAKETEFQFTQWQEQLKALWNRFGAGVGEGVNGFMEQLNTKVGELGPGFTDVASAAMTKAFEGLGEALKGIDTAEWSKTFSTMAESLRGIDAKQLGADIGGAFKNLGETAKSATTAITALAGAIKGISDFLGKIQAVQDFLTGGKNPFAQALQGARDLSEYDPFSKSEQSAKDTEDAWQSALPGTKWVNEQLKNWGILAKEAPPAPPPAIAYPEVPPVPAVRPEEAPAAVAAEPIAAAMEQGAAAAGPALGESVSSALTGAAEQMAGVGETIGSSISAATEGLSGIGDTIGGSISGAMESVSGIGETIGASISGAVEGLSGIGESISAGISGAMSQVQNIGPTISAGVASIGPALSGAASTITSAGQGAGSAISAAAGSLAAAAAAIPRSISVNMSGLPASGGSPGGGAPTGGSSP